MSVADDAEKALRIIRGAKEMAYDTEGSGLDWKKNFPIGYVFTVPETSLYIPVRHGGGGNLPDPKVKPPNSPTDPIVVHRFEKELAKAFLDRVRLNHLTIGHHIKFDCHFSANAGIMLGRNLSCTQNNEALIDEYSKSFSLEACAKAHRVAAKKGDELYAHIASIFGCPADRKSMANYWQLAGDDQIAVDYAKGDGDSTLELFHSQRKIIEEQGLSRVFDLENQLIWTLFRMERRGIKVDSEYLAKLRERVTNEVTRALKSLPEGFNPRSPNDVKAVCLKAGHKNWPTTDKGNPSFTEKFLETFEEGQSIVTVRKWTNLNNTFIEPLIEEHVYKGRVHANLNQLKADDYGTVSGRLSCSSPNLQQIPKRDKKLAPLFRRAFLPDDGYLFYERDYSQCEPRLFGHYSKEPAILDGYSQDPPRDMHQVVADLLAVERDPTAKRMNMGILTGMFPKAFAGYMGWTVPVAQEKWNEWFRAFPKIKDFQQGAKSKLQQRGYVMTLLGRRCRLEKPKFSYRAVSKIIQGGNADILKWFMLRLDKMCEDDGDVVHLLMTVHDAFEWQAPDDDHGREFSAAMDAEMVRVQEPPFNLRVPFAVDGMQGKNWAEATFGPGAGE